MNGVQRNLLALDGQLCFALYTASRAMSQAYRPLLDALGVTYPQYLALLALWEADGEKDGLSVSALGERLSLDSGTLTPLLKRLESAGLVDRSRDREDERVVRLRLTVGGRELRARAEGIPGAMLACTGLSVAELGTLREAVQALATHVRESPLPVLSASPSARRAATSSPSSTAKAPPIAGASSPKPNKHSRKKATP